MNSQLEINAVLYAARTTSRSSSHVKFLRDAANMVSFRTAAFKKSGEISQGFSRMWFQDCLDHYYYFTLIDIHDMNTILPSVFARGKQPQKNGQFSMNNS